MNRKSSTIKSYISTIKFLLKADKYAWDDNKAILGSLTKACKITNDELKTRLPIHWKLLELILFKIQRAMSEQKFLCTLYKALFAVAYYGLFRIGELTEGPHVTKVANVHIGQNKNKILIVLYTSKTHNKGSYPQKIKITGNYSQSDKLASKHFCPFQLLRAYIQCRGNFTNEKEQFFIFADGHPVTPQHARTILRDMLQRLNMKAHLYDFHSLKVDRTNDLFQLGFSVDQIKHLGCWKSNTVYKYLHY